MANDRRSLGIGGGSGAVQRQYLRDASAKQGQYDVYERLGIQRPSGGQSDITRNFVDRYNQIADQSAKDDEREEREDGRKQATMLDRLAYASNKFAENIQNLSGQEQAAKTETKVDDALAFGAGLVTGTLSAPFTGFAQMTEAFTGRRATEMEDGYIPEEDLDFGQRLATGASGTINLIGPMLGGSGEMLKTMGRGAQAAMGVGQKALGFGDDAIRAAGNSAKRSVSSFLGDAAQSNFDKAVNTTWKIAKDSFEEGAEEFFQSPLDEIRAGTIDDDWFGRALEAGGLGALGGGIMSGGSLAVNSLIQKVGDNGGSGKDVKTPTNPDTERTTAKYGFNDTPGTMVKDARDVMQEELRSRQSSTGSTSALQVSTGKVHGLDDGDFGARIFKAMFEYPDGGRSAKMVADFFNMSVNDMATLFSSQDYATQLETVHQRNKANGTAKPLILGRNPDTQNGVYSVDIDHIVDGDYVDLAPATFNFVKSDVDGDTVTMYLDPAVVSQGYVSERLVDPVKATWNNDEQRYEPASNVEHSDFSFIPKSMDEADVRSIFSDVFTRLGVKLDPKTYADRWISGDATTHGVAVRKGTNSDVSMFLDTMLREIDEAKQGVRGHTAVSELYRSLASDPKNEYLRALDHAVEDYRMQIETLSNSFQPASIPNVKYRDTSHGYTTTGAISDTMQNIISVFDQMNLVMAKYSEGKSNSLFRQDGMLAMKAQSKRIRKLNDDLLSIMGRHSEQDGVIDNMIAIAMRQSELGGSVETNVSGVYDIILKSRMDRAVLADHTSGVSTGADLNTMIRTYIDINNDLARAYKSVIEKGIERGDIDPASVREKPILDKDDPLSANNVRSFIETFGDRQISSILDTSNAPALDGVTFNDWLESYIRNGRTARTQFGGYDRDIQKFIDRAIASYYARLKGVSTLMMNRLELISKAIRDLYADGVPTGANKAEGEYLVTALRKVFDPKIANTIGLTSVDSIDDGRWGRLIKSGNKSDICNFVISAGFAGKYDRVYEEFFSAKRAAENKNMIAAETHRLLLVKELEKTALYSATDKRITYEIYRNTKDLDTLLNTDVLSPLYNAIVSLDISFDQKYNSYSAEDSTNGTDLLVDALATERIGPGQTDINARIEKSYSQYAMAVRASYSRNLSVWQSIYSQLSSTGNTTAAAEAIVDLLGDYYCDVSNDVLTGAVYATTTISNAMKEKGMTPSAAQQLMQELELSINGGMTSFHDRVFGSEFGIVSEEDFQSNPMMLLRILVDPSKSVKVTSSRLGGSREINRAEIIREATGSYGNGELSLQNLDAIFRKWPQLITLIPQSKLIPTISMESGGPTVQQKMTSPVFAAIQDRINQMNRINKASGRTYLGGNEFQYNKMRKIVSIQLTNDVDFCGYVIRRLGNIDGRMDIPSLKKRVSMVADRIVDGVLEMATTPDGSTDLIEKLYRVQNAQWKSMVSSVSSVYETAQLIAMNAVSGGNVNRIMRGYMQERLVSMQASGKIMDLIQSTVETSALRNGLTAEDAKALGEDAVNQFIGAIPDDSMLNQNLQAISQNYSNGVKQSVQSAFELMAIINDAFPSRYENIEISDIYPEIRDMKEAIENAIYLDDVQKKTILDQINGKMIDTASDIMRAITNPIVDDIVTVSDFDIQGLDANQVNAKIAATIDKIRSIDHRYNDDLNGGTIAKRVTDDITGLTSGDSERIGMANDDIKNLMRFYNSKSVQRYIESMKFKTGASVNANMLNAYINDQEALLRFVNDSREKIASELGQDFVNQPDVEPGRSEASLIPTADFSDPILDVMSNRSAVNSTRGPAALTVGLNGAEQNTNSPLAFIPRDIHTDVPPRTMTYADIINELEKDNGFVMAGADRNDLRSYPFNRFINAKMMLGSFKPGSAGGQVGYTTTPITIDILEQMRNDTTMSIDVFDPIDSPNGIDQEHSYEVFSSGGVDSLTVLMAMARLTDGSQEGLALKLSKTVGDIKKIVNEIRDNGVNSGVRSVSRSSFADDESFRMALKDSLRSFRIVYRDQLMSVFMDKRNDVLGIGYNNAIDFANFLTPYIEVETTNGTKIIDSRHLFSADGTGFAARMSEIESDGSQVLSARPVSVTPSMIADRIALMESDLVKTDNKIPSKSDADKTAIEAVCNWENSYTVNEISVSDILDGVLPRSAGGLPFEIAEDNQTIVNLFIDAVSGEDTGRAKPEPANARPKGPFTNIEDANRITQANNGVRFVRRNNQVVFGPENRVVVKSFGAYDVDSNSNYRGDADKFKILEDVSNSSNYGDQRSLGIVFTEESLMKAISWSVSYYQDLLIPESMFNSYELQFLGDTDYSQDLVYLDGDLNNGFYIVSPYSNDIYSKAVSHLMKSKSVPLDRDEIATTIFDYTRYIADSAINVNRATMSDMGYDIGRPLVANMPDLFGDISTIKQKYRIADPGELKAAKTMLNSKSKSFDDLFEYRNVDYSLSRGELRNRVTEYLDYAISNNTDHRYDYGQGDCVAIVAVDTDKGVKFAPVMADTNSPVRTRNAVINVDGNNNVVVRGDAYATLASLYDNNESKIAVGNVSYKGIVIPLDRDGMPTFAITDNGKPIEADFAANYDTYSGRVEDWNANLHLSNLWYGNLKYGGSIFYEYNPDTGKWKRREHFDRLIENRVMTEADWISLIYGRNSAWDKVRNGLIPMSEDSTVNELIVQIAKNAKKTYTPINYLLSSISSIDAAGNASMRGMDLDYQLSLAGMSRDEMLRLFHYMNPILCPNGIDDAAHKPGTTLMDHYGRIYVISEVTSGQDAGKMVAIPMDCSIAPGNSLQHSSMQDRVSGHANWSTQHTKRRAMDRPYTNKEMRILLSDIAIRYGDKQVVDIVEADERQREVNRRNDKDSEMMPVSTLDLNKFYSDYDIDSRTPAMTYKEYKHRRDMLATANTFTRDLPIIGYDGGVVDVYSENGGGHDVEMKRLIDAKSKLETEVFGRTISWQRFKWLLIYDGGTTVNGGNGQFRITVNQVKTAVDRMIRNYNRTGLLIASEKSTMSRLDDRYSMPLLDPDTRAWLMSFENISKRFNDNPIEMLNAMKQEAVNMRGLIENIVANGNTSSRAFDAKLKRKALMKFLDWTCYENGIPEMTGYVYNDQYVVDIVNDGNVFWTAVMNRDDLMKFREDMERETERVTQKLADLVKQKDANTSSVDIADGQIINIARSDAMTVNKIADFWTRVSQMNAVLSPGVMLSNIIDKGVHTNMSMVALKIGRRAKLGTFVTDIDINQDAVRMFSANPSVQNAFIAYRMSLIDGSTGELLNVVNNEADLAAWIDAKRKSGTKFQHVSDKLFDMMNGGNLFMTKQINNMINYFFIIEHDAGHDFWFEKGPDGRMLCEEQMTQENAGKMLIDMLTGQNPVSFDNAQIAMNFALQGDMAQRNVVSMLYQELCRRFPASKFLTTTFVSRFFQYRTNQIGRTLQWVLPVSSFNYWATNTLARYGQSEFAPDWLRQLHVEDANVFASGKRALLNDVCHMAPVVVAYILSAIPGVVAPPEDEKKAGNPEEWLFLGQRIYADWELEDILGMALPWTAFFKSAQLGNPRIDILINGLASQLYNNPIAKVSDIVAMFGEGEGSLLTSYEEDVETYEDAKGGSPSWSEWLMGKFQASALSYAGQFITPMFMKEFFDEPYEHSYNNIYEETTTGALTEEGQYGRTMKTDYQDAQIRKITRNNPVLAWIMNWVNHPTTGYLESEMPLVEIYDPIQMDNMKMLSINNEDGTPKSRNDQEATIAEIIAILQQTDDMEALVATGFYLDYDTRFAVGDTIWDICTQLTDQYNDMLENGELDYYVLGNGDFTKGQAEATRIKSAYYDELNYWKSLYYDKLESEPLRRSLVVYNRYKTTYARDDDGNYYATGYNAYTGGLASLLPIKMAPGNIDIPEGTMGYEGDFMTPSAVVEGESTGQRALVPAEAGYYDTVDFEAHAVSGDGTGYSQRWNGATSTGYDNNDDDDDSTGGTRYPYYRRSYGGGGGGGGGGGYAPNLYSRLPNVYMPSSRTMYAERIYSPNYDYLRPNFETKGSREAYKRSDI